MDLDVICVMAGNSFNIILPIIEQRSVKIQIAEKDHVHVIILKRKKELLIQIYLTNFSNLFLKTGL